MGCKAGKMAGLRTWKTAVGVMFALSLSACTGYGLHPDDPIPAAHWNESDQAQKSFAIFLDSLKGRNKERAALQAQQEIGDQLAARMLKKVRLSKNKGETRRLERLMARLATATPRAVKDWHVYLVEDPRPNAFTTGGGHLFITTGMVRLLGDDEKIATVLAHEMAHNTLAHVIYAREKKAMARDAHAFSWELARSTNMEWLGKSLSFIVNTTLNSYSRQQEDEADAEGLDYLVKAGWEPQVALRTFDVLSRHYHDAPELKNFFYGNHPTYTTRRWHLANVIRAHYRKEAGLPEVRRRNFRARGDEGRSASVKPEEGTDVRTLSISDGNSPLW